MRDPSLSASGNGTGLYTSSTFYYCTSPTAPTGPPPTATTVYTTTWETVLVTACPTTCFSTTYTITETCTGDSATYATPTVPPGFVISTVTCPVCPTPTMVITCPGPLMTNMATATTSANVMANTLAAGPGSTTGRAAMSTATGIPRVTAGAARIGGGVAAKLLALSAIAAAVVAHVAM